VCELAVSVIVPSLHSSAGPGEKALHIPFGHRKRVPRLDSYLAHFGFRHRQDLRYNQK